MLWLVFLLPLSAAILVILAVIGHTPQPPTIPDDGATGDQAMTESMRTTIRIMQDVTTHD